MWDTNSTFVVAEILQGGGANAAAFNFFFTLLAVFGVFALGIAMVFYVINRS